MSLITINELTIGFRGPSLLDSVTCQIEPNQRIGLLGRNGAGKTTLMKVLCGDLEPDGGSVELRPGTRVSLLPQDVPQHIQGTINEIVASGWDDDFADESDQAWRAQHAVDQILSRMELAATSRFETLSSGMKRRVLLARALVANPELLLLDEPTNHLDIQAIDWLEKFLLQWNTTLMFVTHDRMFLQKLATRILEIDRGRLFDWSCDYNTFLQRKEQALAAEEKQHCALRQKTRRGGTLDSPRHQGAADAQRGPRAGFEETARTTSRATPGCGAGSPAD